MTAESFRGLANNLRVKGLWFREFMILILESCDQGCCKTLRRYEARFQLAFLGCIRMGDGVGGMGLQAILSPKFALVLAR